jgi:hypothetical protein
VQTRATRPASRRESAPPARAAQALGRRGRVFVGAAGALAAGVTGTLAVARVAFDRQLSREVEHLFAAARTADPSVLGEAELVGLPEPVQRWLRSSGVVGEARPVAVRLRHAGDFRLGEDRGWVPYESQAYYTTNPPALLWTVEMRLFGVVPIVGRDRYRDGEGGIKMKACSLVPVVDKAGGGLNQGSLLRYLGETVWFPAGAVAPYIRWAARDADSAVATMTYGGVTASLTFGFDAAGRVIRQETPDRYNDAKGRPERWSVPIAEWGELAGVRVPTAGEAVWNYDTGDYPYIRWRVTDIEYERPERY